METESTVNSREANTLRDYLKLLRPSQWVKNIVVFAAPAAALKLFDPAALLSAVGAFFAFSFASSGVYAINDVLDRDTDALHPVKRNRPVARGAISPEAAICVASIAFAAALGLTWIFLNGMVMVILILYFGIMLAYSLALKEHVLLDVIVIAGGFVLRAWGGAAAVDVPTSEWLVVCVFTLCMFLGFGKRRCELAMLAQSGAAGEHRRTLLRYTPDLLNHLITVSAGIAIVTFLLYTMDVSRTPSPFHKENLFYTLPIVVYGVFRYAMLTELGIYSGPTEILLQDRWMMVSILVWAICALGIAYHDPLVIRLGFPEWRWSG